MIWWAKSRALPLSLLLLLVDAILSLLGGGSALPMPSLVASVFVPVAISYLAPLVPVLFVCYGLSRGQCPPEQVAVRRVIGYDLAFGAVLVAVASVICGFAGFAGVWPLAGGYLRNLIGFLGLALLAVPVAGVRVAGLLPVSVVLGAALFGTSRSGGAFWWAWPIADSGSPLAAGSAVLVAAVGAVAYRLRAGEDPLLQL